MGRLLKGLRVFKRVGYVAVATLILAIHVLAQLNQNCTVSILNRNARVQADGKWRVEGVPAGATVRARATCIDGGVTRTGETGLVSIVPDQGNAFDASITLGTTTPIANTLSLTAPLTTLNAPNATTQLTVTANYPTGPPGNVTAASTGTRYTVSNAAIATVSADGLVQALSSGTVVIQANNEGSTGMIQITVSIGADTDNDGIPDSIELQYGLNPNDPVDALQDQDQDGLTNVEEYRLGTSLNDTDSDDDLIPDFIEVRLGLDPRVATPRMAVSGRVVNGGGANVAGATVVALGMIQAVTNASGTFQLAAVPATLGSVTLTAFAAVSGQQWVGYSAGIAPAAGGTVDAGSIVIAPVSGVLSGVISDPLGNGAGGTQITVACGAVNLTGTADALGRYTVTNVPNGVCTVNAFHAATGFRGSGTGNLPEVARVDVRIGPMGSVQGTVYRSNGTTPYQGVAVTLVDGIQWLGNAITGANGSYSMAVRPASFQVRMEAPGSVSLTSAQTYTVGFGEARTVNLNHPGNGVVNVTVRDAAEALVNGADVTAFAASPYAYRLRDKSVSGTAQFTVAAGNFTVTAAHPATGLSGSVSSAVAENGTVGVTVNLTGSLPGTVRGVIRWDATNPVPYPDVFITQTDAGGQIRTFFAGRFSDDPNGSDTDADGSYVITGLSVGPFTLTAQSEEGATVTASGTVTDVNAPVVLNATMPASATVSGILRRPDGSAFVGGTLRLTAPSLPFAAQPPETDAQGAFRVLGVPVGPYVLYGDTINGGGGSYLRYGSAAGVAGQAGQTYSTDVTLEETGTVTGTVYLADGVMVAPNTQVDIEVYGKGFEAVHTVTANGSGVFTWCGAYPGKVLVTARTAQGAGEAAAEGSLAGGGTATINVRFGSAADLQGGVIYPLAGTNGFRYGTNDCLGMSPAGTSDGRLSSPALSSAWPEVNRALTFTGCLGVAIKEASGRQLARAFPLIFPTGVYQERKIYVPESGGFVRYLDSFTNPHAVALTVPIRRSHRRTPIL